MRFVDKTPKSGACYLVARPSRKQNHFALKLLSC